MNFKAAESEYWPRNESSFAVNVVQMPSASPYRAAQIGGLNERKLCACDRITSSNDRCPGLMTLLHYCVHSTGTVQPVQQ